MPNPNEKDIQDYLIDALLMGTRVAPAMAGAVLTGAPTMGLAAVGGGAVGGLFGEVLAQHIERYLGRREEINPWEIGVSGLTGAIPVGKVAQVGLMSRLLREGGKGGAIGGVSDVAMQAAEQGTLRPDLDLGRTLLSTGFGTVAGSGSGALTRVDRDRVLDTLFWDGSPRTEAQRWRWGMGRKYAGPLAQLRRDAGEVPSYRPDEILPLTPQGLDRARLAQERLPRHVRAILDRYRRSAKPQGRNPRGEEITTRVDLPGYEDVGHKSSNRAEFTHVPLGPRGSGSYTEDEMRRALIPASQRAPMSGLEVEFAPRTGRMSAGEVAELPDLLVGDVFSAEGISPQIALRGLGHDPAMGTVRLGMLGKEIPQELDYSFRGQSLYPAESADELTLNLPIEDFLSSFGGQRVRHGNTLRVTPGHAAVGKRSMTHDPHMSAGKRAGLSDALEQDLATFLRGDFADDLINIVGFPTPPAYGLGRRTRFDPRLGARTVQANHRLDAIRRLVNKGVLDPKAELPVVARWVGEGFTEPSGWFPRSQMEQFLQTPISTLAQRYGVAEGGEQTFLKALLEQWKGQPYREGVTDILERAARKARGG